MNKIEIKGISKQFGNVWALSDIDLNFEENKIYGLLGRNGAGKSTLLNIITNKIFASSGEVRVNGENAIENDHALKNVFLMSEKNYYPNNMKIREIFKWSKEFYPGFDMDYANNLAIKFGLNINKRVKELSTGYSSIFKIIIALSVPVQFILLDEPVLGLDANHRDLFYRLLIENYQQNPRTIVISTHLIEEVSNVIEDIIIIKDGKILKNESVEELLSKGYSVAGSAAAIDDFITGKNVISCDSFGGLKTACVLGKIDKTQIPQGIEVNKLDLQKLFIQLTNV
ncbi:MAG: ABC-type multidrug transport system, ATPase component [Oscillospiraceae bacterium]|nr:ABC-type multidrug transport system, ATPase component [Oscillospiraceae bacterium]